MLVYGKAHGVAGELRPMRPIKCMDVHRNERNELAAKVQTSAEFRNSNSTNNSISSTKKTLGIVAKRNITKSKRRHSYYSSTDTRTKL